MDTDQERGSDSTPMEQRLGRITVSVFYTQNDGQYLLWDTGATVRAIWLCDATKIAEVMERLISMMWQQMIET